MENMGKDQLERAEEIKRRIRVLADHVWDLAGGDMSTPTNLFDGILHSVASYMSCLADEDIISESDEGRMDALGGLLANLRTAASHNWPRKVPPPVLRKRKFRVEVIAKQPTTTWVEVEATCPDEARGLAEAKVGDDIAACDWEEQGIEDTDISSSVVESDCCCNEANHRGPCCPGWVLPKHPGSRAVERCDSCTIFPDDDAALAAYLASRA